MCVGSVNRSQCTYHVLLSGRKILKGLLGDKCFDDGGGSVGKFWRLIQTRPYMRVLQNLYELHLEQGDYEDAV